MGVQFVDEGHVPDERYGVVILLPWLKSDPVGKWHHLGQEWVCGEDLAECWVGWVQLK